MQSSLETQNPADMGVFVGPDRGILNGSIFTVYQAISFMSDQDAKRVAKKDATHIAGAQSATGIKIQGMSAQDVLECVKRGHACGLGSIFNTSTKKSKWNCKYVASNHYR